MGWFHTINLAEPEDTPRIYDIFCGQNLVVIDKNGCSILRGRLYRLPFAHSLSPEPSRGGGGSLGGLMLSLPR